jgi:hypothetical protein
MVITGWNECRHCRNYKRTFMICINLKCLIIRFLLFSSLRIFDWMFFKFPLLCISYMKWNTFEKKTLFKGIFNCFKLMKFSWFTKLRGKWFKGSRWFCYSPLGISSLSSSSIIIILFWIMMMSSADMNFPKIPDKFLPIHNPSTKVRAKQLSFISFIHGVSYE